MKVAMKLKVGPMFRKLKGKNLVKQHMRIAKEISERLKKYKGVIGIVALGGVARGYSDKFSDIDIIVFCEKKIENFPIREEEFEFKGTTIDIGVCVLEDEAKKFWDQGVRWAFSDSIILYDPKGEIRAFLKNKLIYPENERKEILIENMTQCEWHCNAMALGWIYRGDIVSAHYSVNCALECFIKVLFALNKEFDPGEKWRLFCLHALQWLPKNSEKYLKEPLKVRDFTLEELERRRRALNYLWQATLPKVEEEVKMKFEKFKKLV